jgi:hypothetical protein
MIEEDLISLEKKGIHIYRDLPKKVDLVFLCVAHDEIKRFLETYKGLVFDYRNIKFN